MNQKIYAAAQLTLADAITAYHRKCRREGTIPLQPSRTDSEDTGDTFVLRNVNGYLTTYDKIKRRFVKQANDKPFYELSVSEQKAMSASVGMFGAIRSYAEQDKRLFEKKRIELGSK